MIVALVGTNPYSFDRMLRPLDDLAARHDWDVFVQTGHTDYRPVACRHEAFVERRKLEALIGEAELVVSHGGFGSIRDALVHGKPVVAVPRKPELGESQDYQEEMVREMEACGLVLGVYDIGDLESVIERARSFSPGRVEKSRIPDLIAGLLAQRENGA